MRLSMKRQNSVVFLFSLPILSSIAQFTQIAGPNQPCNPDRDVLLLDYPTSSPAAYLRCMPIGISGMGYWSQNFCPSGMNFDFITQTCRAVQSAPVHGTSQRKDDLLNIAILNGTCANGEQCIGGTVCDSIERRCLCPVGTIANLETLSCTSTTDGSYRHETFATSPSTTPIPQLPTETIGRLEPTTAGPGEKCSNNEVCTGGSFCMKIVGLCLCPNELESYNGQCVHPKFAKNRLPKVPLGAACGNMVTCDHGSVCINSMCQCVTPAIEHQGRCVEYVITRKQVGPGELCNDEAVCGKGSICDSKIPVCVCPAGTDLDNGECVQVRTTLAALNTFYTKPTKVFPDSQSFARYGALPSAMSGDKRVLVYPTVSIPGTAHLPYAPGPQAPMYRPAVATASPLSTSTVTLTTSKPPSNPFQLTSNRRLTVGMACTLNADCVSDAYCSGNTQPPTCQCLATSVPINGKCEKIVFPGQVGCFDDRQCGAAYPLARCLNRQCVCPLGTKSMEQTCVPVPLILGSICDPDNINRRCPPGAHCLESICQCVPPLIQSGEECVQADIQSLPTPEPWPLKCADSRECPRGFLCMEGSCACAWDGSTNGNCPTAETRRPNLEVPTATTPQTPQFGDPMDNGENQEDETMAAIDAALGTVESSLLSRETAESLERILSALLKINLPKNSEVESTDEKQQDALEGVATATEEEFQRLAKRQVLAMLNEVVESKNKEKMKEEEANRSVNRNSLRVKREASTTTPNSFPIEFESTEVEDQPNSSSTSIDKSADMIDSEHQIEKRELNDATSVQIRQRGESCVPGDICLNGTSCIRSICACPTGFVVKNDTCVKVELKALNARCVAGVDRCAGNGACRSGRCVCVDGATEIQQRCRQKLNGKCVHGEMCSGGSRCSAKTKRCECSNGRSMTKNTTSCLVQIVSAGALCTKGEVCAGSICKDGRCSCLPDGYVQRGGKCIRSTTKPPMNPNSQRPTNVHRVVNATHSAGAIDISSPRLSFQHHATYARPPKLSRSLNGNGLPITTALPGESCKHNEACMGGSICLGGQCACSDDEVIVDSKCVSNDGEALQNLDRMSKSKPGELCSTENTECLNNSICVSNICTCKDGWTLFRGDCLQIGQGTDLETIHSQAMFFSPNALDSLMDATTLKTVVPGAMCTLNLECPYRTDCIRGVCRCRRSETIVNGMCRRAIYEVPPGGRCDTQKGLDCIGESHCFYGICGKWLFRKAADRILVCLYGLVNTGSECASAEVLKTAGVGESCELGQTCSSGTCTNGICECAKDEEVDENGRCISNNQNANTQPLYSYPSGQTKMSSHKNDKETIIYGNGAAEEGRFNQILTAKQMSINVVDLETLKALVTGQFMKMPQTGDKCDGSEMCGSNARCVRGVCQCSNGYSDNDGTCQAQESGVSTAESTDSQTTNQDGYVDQQQQIMSNGIGGFYPTYQQPYMPSATPFVQGVGMPGSYCNGHFCYGGGTCVNGICVCRPGYALWGNQCQISPVSLGSPCYLNEQCVHNNGICTEGVCSCGRGVPPLQRHRFHRCPDRPTARPGEECANGQLCVFNSVCGQYSGVCECPIGFETTIQRGTGECVPVRRARGSFCFGSPNCHRNSYCDNGYCMCKAGFVPVDNFCLPAPRAVVDDPRSLMGSGNDLGLAAHTPPRNPMQNFGAAVKRVHHRHHARPVAIQRPLNPAVSVKGRIQKAKPGEHCGSDRICVGNSHCTYGFCKCEDGTRNDGHKCVKMKIRRPQIHLSASSVRRSPWRGGVAETSNGIGNGNRLPFESCELDRESCMDGARCSQKAGLGFVCVCLPDRLPFMGICIRRRSDVQPVGLGEPCSPADLCTNGSECLNGNCRCTKDRTERGGFCIIEAKLGETCVDGRFCQKNAECRIDVGACVCPITSNAAADGCVSMSGIDNLASNSINPETEIPQIRTAAPGDLCDPNIQCLNGSYCSAFGFCNCAVGYVEVYSMCISADRVRAPGEQCSAANNDLCTNDSWCKDGMCKCLNGYEPFRARCRHDYRTVNVPSAQRKTSGGLTATNPHRGSENSIPQLPPVVQHGDPENFGPVTNLLQHQQQMLMMHPGRRPETNLGKPQRNLNSLRRTKESPNGLPITTALPGDLSAAAFSTHHIRIYRLEHTCRSNSECPAGAHCSYSRCFCNKLPLRNRTSPTATTCSLDTHCMEPLNCMDGRCVCIQDLPPIPPPNLPVPLPPLPVPLPTLPISIPLPTTSTLPPPTTTATITTTEQPAHVTSEVERIVIPGAFCDQFSRCTFDAKCQDGRCICIDEKKSIVLRHGRSVCEFVDIKPRERTTYRPVMPTNLAPGERCEFSSQCRRNFVCLESICVCVDEVDDTSCKEEDKRRSRKNPTTTTTVAPPLIPPGGSCSAGEKCSGQAVCHRGWCVCPDPMMIIQNGQCTRAAPVVAQQNCALGSSCQGQLRQQQIQPAVVAAVKPQEQIQAYRVQLNGQNAGYSQQQAIQTTHATQPPTRLPTFTSQPLITETPSTSPAPSLLTPRTVAPGKNCGPYDKCSGGSLCIAGYCLCPAGMSPSAQGVCEVRQFPSTVTPEVPLEEVVRPRLKYARPLESCKDENVICTGGSMCQQKQRCACPTNKPHIRNYICTSDDLIQQQKLANSGGVWSCEASLKCPDNSICDGNECKCIPGYQRAQDKCIHVPKLLNVQVTTEKPNLTKKLITKDPIEGPTVEELIRIQQAQLQHHLRQIEAEQLRRQKEQNRILATAKQNNTAHQPFHLQLHHIQQIQRQHMEHQLSQLPVHHLAPRAVPRIVGPRLKRPNAKKEVELGDADRRAVCPPGNEPLRDESSGRLRICNGLEPHCPPKSYCYVTGVASADYNCYYEFALPNKLCDQNQICTGGSICDSVLRKCICLSGHQVQRNTCVRNFNSSAEVGEPCDQFGCQSSAVCREKVCECPKGEQKDDDGYCTKLNRRRFSSYRPQTPASLAQRCPLPEHPERCQLPDCFCSRNGREPVSGIPLQKIPQIVVLTFDDPINDKSMRDYRHIFNDFQLLNPNGCPIRGTFFVSHEWTNYNEVQWLAEQGHELASNSISHRLLSGANWTEWLSEIDGQRRVMAKFANVVDSEIVGMRAPQLGLGGDVQFLMAKNAGFIYDNTINADPDVNGAPFWPHTLDFAVPYRCENDYCPGVSVPGFWVIPNNVYHGSTEFLRSSMLQGILTGNETTDHVLYYMFRNFNRAYSQNRAPYVLNLNAEFLQSHGGIGMRALENFLGLMRQYRDVYFMTLRELIEWMKNPQSVDQLAQRSGCQVHMYAPPSSRVCTQPNKCIYQTPTLGSKEHQFLSCNTCPMIYPWTGNPTGAF
ncbi:hypothetical protein M3Y96_00405400 [Aphelenchoides besseyi]|nr:hypothetical protein M3Y96_00405400 [Aphelenchoides besseyi]